jgi:hypothetical protein
MAERGCGVRGVARNHGAAVQAAIVPARIAAGHCGLIGGGSPARSERCGAVWARERWIETVSPPGASRSKPKSAARGMPERPAACR